MNFLIGLLEETDLFLCEESKGYDPGFYPTSKSLKQILYEYFDIDPLQEDLEKKAILEYISNLEV